MSPQLCWFLNAGNIERQGRLTGRRPKKRQGTKSREVGQLAKQWALSGFNAGAALDGKRDASTRRRAMSAYRESEESAAGISAGA